MNTVIVEDYKPTLDYIKDLLTQLKAYRFIGSAKGEEEAVSLISEARPDLVILDLGLASGSGLNVLRRVRHLGCGARVLVVTNWPEDAYRQACLESGADGFFDKSREIPELYMRLKNWIPAAPANEDQRLRALHKLSVLDTQAEEAFDEVTRVCAEMLNVPIALVSLVDEQRQWFKSRIGLDEHQTARTVAFCAHAIQEPRTLVVEDATADARFADNPLVRGPLHLRFYAGVPLTLSGGEPVGTLCVMDRAPRKLTAEQQNLLEVLGRSVVNELEQRQRVVDLEAEVQHRREMEVRVMHMATRDALTGLPNRAALFDRLQQGIRIAEREKHGLAFLFLDLDQFKLINDTMGHQVGDNLLQQVAERLTSTLRESDTVARIGGDEFAVVLHRIESPEHAKQVAGKIFDTLQDPVRIGRNELHATSSLGLAIYPEHGDNCEALIRHADLALYEAKHAGRHQWRCFEPSMNDAAHQRMTLESELRTAIEKRQLSLHYQPQLNSIDGKLVGLEALLRWEHPQRGWIPPAGFIPLAEETGLIWDIGRFVIEEACRQVTEWDTHGLSTPRLSINVSPAQLRPELVDLLQANLAGPGCAGKLEIEITESALTADVPQVMTLLEQVRAMGVRIAMDDFGVGYSSLSQMRRLPLDTLKVDKSFVDDIVTDQQDASIVSAILQMCEALGLQSVAEGVESTDQLQALQTMGCNTIQGFLFCRPLPANEVEPWLERN